METDGLNLNPLVSAKGTAGKMGEVYRSYAPPTSKEIKDVKEKPKTDSAEKEPVDEEKLKAGIDNLNHSLQAFNIKISFSKDEPTGRTVIRVSNSESDEIIREIPPEQFLKIAAKLSELMGLLVDQKI